MTSNLKGTHWTSVIKASTNTNSADGAHIHKLDQSSQFFECVASNDLMSLENTARYVLSSL